MAATAPLDAASLELARSLPIESIPERLRCVTCDKLAFHAMKLPCCDNNICGDCYENLNTSECPLCTHSPFSADTCTPAKSLQTTTKVFLKNELKKRGADGKHSTKASVDTPTLPAADSIEPAIPTPTAVESTPVAADGNAEDSGEPVGEPTNDLESASVPPITQTEDDAVNGVMEDTNADVEQDEEDDDDDDDVVITTERPPTEEKHFAQGEEENNVQNDMQGDSANEQMQMNQQQGFGFDQNMNGFGNGDFGNMNMNMNGFNPMMGMPGFPMGMPNMMGMMDPSMMFNGNFGGMGDMSAMMGMGMNGMGGNMAGMGDFNGMGGPGFFPNQGNYMQSSNYGNNAHRQNFSNDRGYGRGYGRGFGRGRGNQYGRGRGGWGYQQQHQYGHNQQFGQNQFGGPGGPQQSGTNTSEVTNHRRASPSYEAAQGAEGDNARQNETNDGQDTAATNTENANVADESAFHMKDDGNNVHGQDRYVPQDQSTEQTGSYGEGGQFGQSAMQEFDEGMHNRQHFTHGDDNFAGRGGFRGRGGFARGSDITELTPAPAPPVNAPTGPKAMRQGLPNTGWASRALAQKPTPTPAPEVKAPSRSVEPPKQDDVAQDNHQNGERGRSRTPDDYKHRSSRGKDVEDDYESDETYARRKQRERRKRKEREERYEDEKDGDESRSNKKYRSRSESRDDDSSRRRHRDKGEEHRSSRSHRNRSKDRHHRRHRSRSPVEEEDEYSRRKSKGDRDRDADYDHKDSHRSSRKHSRREDEYEEDRKDRSHRSSKHERREERESERDRPRTIIEPPSDELGFKIKGSRSAKIAPPPARNDRRSSAQQESTSSDPYAEERARAQQDRMAKEALRRQSSSTLGKRGREGDDEVIDAPRGPKGDRSRVKKGRKERRIGYKYEDEVDGEDERDAGRWR